MNSHYFLKMICHVIGSCAKKEMEGNIKCKRMGRPVSPDQARGEIRLSWEWRLSNFKYLFATCKFNSYLPTEFLHTHFFPHFITIIELARVKDETIFSFFPAPVWNVKAKASHDGFHSWYGPCQRLLLIVLIVSQF